MDQVFIMPSTICSSHISGTCVNRRLNSNKSLSLHWIVFVWLMILLPASNYHTVHGLDELHIGGIFPIGGKGGWQGGQACQPAAELALEDVNNKSDLLPGFRLTLFSNDSEVCILIVYHSLHNITIHQFQLTFCHSNKRIKKKKNKRIETTLKLLENIPKKKNDTKTELKRI